MDKQAKKSMAALLALVMTFAGAAYGCGKTKDSSNTQCTTTSLSTTEQVTTTAIQDEFISYAEALELAKKSMPEVVKYHDYRKERNIEDTLLPEQLATAIVLFGNEDKDEIAIELIKNYNETNNSTDPKSIMDYATGFVGFGGNIDVLLPNSQKIAYLAKLIKSGASDSEIANQIIEILKSGTSREKTIAVLSGIKKKIIDFENYEYEDVLERFGNETNDILSDINGALEQQGVNNTQPSSGKHK